MDNLIQNIDPRVCAMCHSTEVAHLNAIGHDVEPQRHASWCWALTTSASYHSYAPPNLEARRHGPWCRDVLSRHQSLGSKDEYKPLRGVNMNMFLKKWLKKKSRRSLPAHLLARRSVSHLSTHPPTPISSLCPLSHWYTSFLSLEM